MIAHSQACWLVILASLVTILLHFLSRNHTVSIWDGVKLWLIAPWLCLLGTSHVEAAGMLLGPEGGRSRVEGSTVESGGSEGILRSSQPCIFPLRWACCLLLSNGSMVLYWANLSPHKTRTALVHTEWESVSLLCSSRDGEDEKKEKDSQIRRKMEHLWITGLCN